MPSMKKATKRRSKSGRGYPSETIPFRTPACRLHSRQGWRQVLAADTPEVRAQAGSTSRETCNEPTGFLQDSGSEPGSLA